MAARSLESSRRMGRWMLRSKQDHEFAAGAADVSGTDGEDGVGGSRFLQQKFNSALHGAEIVDVFVAGFANGGGQGFAGDAGDGIFAGGVNIREDKNIGLIEGFGEIVPEMLRAREAMRLKENEKSIEFAAARGVERGSNFRRVVAVIVNDGDVGDDAFDVEAAADASKVGEAFAN